MTPDIHKRIIDEVLKELKRKNAGFMTMANYKKYLIHFVENRLKEGVTK